MDDSSVSVVLFSSLRSPKNVEFLDDLVCYSFYRLGNILTETAAKQDIVSWNGSLNGEINHKSVLQ